MSRAQKRESQPWLRYLVLPFVLILFGLVVSYALLAQQGTPSPTPISGCYNIVKQTRCIFPPCNPETVLVCPSTTPTPTPTPTPTHTPAEFVCPVNGWINCMPILTKEAAKFCTPQAIAWYKQNCPGFQGVAY